MNEKKFYLYATILKFCRFQHVDYLIKRSNSRSCEQSSINLMSALFKQEERKFQNVYFDNLYKFLLDIEMKILEFFKEKTYRENENVR